LRRKILKKLRTASLNSEFAGSYKKVYIVLSLNDINSCVMHNYVSIQIRMHV